jgi:hypothetical protein
MKIAGSVTHTHVSFQSRGRPLFFTRDNAGYIRINYTTNVDVAETVNPLALHSNPPRPLISHPGTMGGYRYPILEKIAAGKHFQILKCPLPGNSKPARAALDALFDDPNTLYSYVEGTTITTIQVDGWDNRTQSLADLGWLVRSSQKTFKRFKTLNRPFRFWSNPDRQLKVYVIDDLAYASDDVVDLNPEEHERLLDGGIVISPGLYKECLNNVEFPEVAGEVLTANVMRADAFRKQAQRFRTFNARIFGEFDYSGCGATEDFTQMRGQLKGQAFVDASDACERMGVDIICARSALKPEVSGIDTFVLLDPQLAKYQVTGDVQSISNNPALFEPEFIKRWMKIVLLSAFEDLKNDKLMEHWYNLGSPEFDSDNNVKHDQDDLISLTKWNARAWIMSGMSLKDSPWLFEQMARNIISIIHVKDIKKMRIPVPCAVRAQVISSSMSAAAGEDIDVQPGQLRWNRAHECMVVSDQDWIEMYESHGGNDLDDFFVGYWRTRGDKRVVFITRSPNDFGEYSMFDYVEGDWYPCHELSDGTIVEFPKVTDDPSMYPKRLSEAVRDKDVIYVGLPSEKMEPYSTGNEWYGIEDIEYAISNNKDSAAVVGAAVNARTLWSVAKREHHKVQVCSMEGCIDTGVQGGCLEDINAVRDEAQAIVKEIISDPALKIDHYLWTSRFARFNRDLSWTRLTQDTHISQIHRHRVAFTKFFINMSTQYVTDLFDPKIHPEPTEKFKKVHNLGKKYYRMGVQFLRFSRRAIAMSREDSESLAPGFLWGDIHNYILGEIDKLPKITDRHDMIMAIYSACLKVPSATTRKISDQLVMNPAFFDRLMAALRHYGIAGHLVIDEHGHIRRHYDQSWVLSCVNCDFVTTTVDPMVLQSYHHYDGLCAQCYKMFNE